MKALIYPEENDETETTARSSGRKRLATTPLTARQLMTADPETVTADTHLVTAAAKLGELGLRHLPYVDVLAYYAAKGG